MAADIPTTEPAQIRAGDTIAWTKSLPDYLASEYVLHYRLINASARFDITCTASGDDHLANIPAATSASYTAGDYTFQSWVTKAVERYTTGSGRIKVLPDLAAVTASGYDSRSTAKKTLELVDAAMLAHGASAWTQEYEIAGRRMKFTSVGDFMAFRSRLQFEVFKEENTEIIKNGGRPRNRLNVRF